MKDYEKSLNNHFTVLQDIVLSTTGEKPLGDKYHNTKSEGIWKKDIANFLSHISLPSWLSSSFWFIIHWILILAVVLSIAKLISIGFNVCVLFPHVGFSMGLFRMFSSIFTFKKVQKKKQNEFVRNIDSDIKNIMSMQQNTRGKEIVRS